MSSNISREIQIEASAGTYLGTPIFVNNTNLEFEYEYSLAASDPVNGASGNGGASQGGSVMLIMDSTNQMLYVTGSAAATSSASCTSDVLGISGDGVGSSAFQVEFTVSGTCNFTLQASTYYSQPWFAGPPSYPGPTPSYPQCAVVLSGVTSTESTEFGYNNGAYPADSGIATGTISGRGGLVADIYVSSSANPRDGYPSEVSQNATLSYALTIYPASPGGGSGSGNGNNTTNNPVLGISYDGTNIILSWPMCYPNYLLTSTTNLASSNWPVILTPPGIVGSLWEVTNPVIGNSQFFRLLQTN
jgi:hypothetical protein